MNKIPSYSIFCLFFQLILIVSQVCMNPKFLYIYREIICWIKIVSEFDEILATTWLIVYTLPNVPFPDLTKSILLKRLIKYLHYMWKYMYRKMFRKTGTSDSAVWIRGAGFPNSYFLSNHLRYHKNILCTFSGYRPQLVVKVSSNSETIFFAGAKGLSVNHWGILCNFWSWL